MSLSPLKTLELGREEICEGADGRKVDRQGQRHVGRDGRGRRQGEGEGEGRGREELFRMT